METQASSGIIIQKQVEYGKTIDSSVMETGLIELNPGLHFDMGGKLGLWHPRQDHRQGVFYEGQHLCSMDRGVVPEFKLWDMTSHSLPCSWAEADKEEVSLKYEEQIPHETPDWIGLCEIALGGKDPSLRIERGKLFRITPHKRQVVARRCVRVGWRHTFERMLNRQVPGITRQSLAAKFGVDMYKFPVGSPDEVIAALMEE